MHPLIKTLLLSRARPARACIAWLISLPLLAVGCEKPFEPIQANDYAFSIYGHLEATADTQWVRVTSIRTSLETVPEPIDAVVTLEEIETGTTVVMNDSLVHYRSLNFDEDTYAHNFSTTMSIVPGRHYRLTASRSDGASTTATVLIPVIEDPVMEMTFRYYVQHPSSLGPLRPARGSIRGMRHIGMILGLEDVDYVAPTCAHPVPVHQQYLRVLHHGDGASVSHVALLEYMDPEDGNADLADLIELRPQYVGRIQGSRDPASPIFCDVGPKTIAVIASGSEWPYGETTNLRELAHPAAANNIEGGIGFLAGVQTHWFPFERCIPLTRQDTCRITFSERSATLVGLLTDSCDGRPLGASVTLSGPPAGGSRIAMREGVGRFRIHGLDPGVPYTVSISPDSAHIARELEPLTFEAAAVDTVVFSLVDPRYELACPL